MRLREIKNSAKKPMGWEEIAQASPAAELDGGRKA